MPMVECHSLGLLKRSLLSEENKLSIAELSHMSPSPARPNSNV
jgi:hypothetical protein